MRVDKGLPDESYVPLKAKTFPNSAFHHINRWYHIVVTMRLFINAVQPVQNAEGKRFKNGDSKNLMLYLDNVT